MVDSISSRLKRAITGQLVAGQKVRNIVAGADSKVNISMADLVFLKSCLPCGKDARWKAESYALRSATSGVASFCSCTKMTSGACCCGF